MGPVEIVGDTSIVGQPAENRKGAIVSEGRERASVRFRVRETYLRTWDPEQREARHVETVSAREWLKESGGRRCR